MSESLIDRCKLLVELARLIDLEAAGSSSYKRWQNVKQGQAKIRAEEVEILGRVFPQYRWWLMTGEVMPDKGQTSPDYDEEHVDIDEFIKGLKPKK